MNEIYIIAGCSGSHEDRVDWEFGFVETLNEALRITEMLNNKWIEFINLSLADKSINSTSSVIKESQKLMLAIDPKFQLNENCNKDSSFYYFYSVNKVINIGV